MRYSPNFICLDCMDYANFFFDEISNKVCVTCKGKRFVHLKHWKRLEPYLKCHQVADRLAGKGVKEMGA